MAFFEDFKKNASNVADKAAKKTNELTNIAKLNVNIKSAEAKLNTVYEEIGRLFYNAERSGEDYTADIAASIMKADKLKADIVSYKASIAKLKKLVVCEACGNEISEDFAFCSFCGAKVVKPEPEEVIEEEPILDEEAEEVDDVEETEEAEETEISEEEKDAE
ncbi:MAG: zinc-ribbon domain-containing protein [Ruminococcaceae bacterium]|nr:zinc-ribbon domain-containing protein [Oscillospiraceae bacterium]